VDTENFSETMEPPTMVETVTFHTASVLRI